MADKVAYTITVPIEHARSVFELLDADERVLTIEDADRLRAEVVRLREECERLLRFERIVLAQETGESA